jgi:hypothetical protein
MSQLTYHAAQTRGHAQHGWLDSYHTFSFSSYYDPQRTHFGALRVINDDTVAGGMGFGTHPHDNMEIVSIPLEGALEHKDSMGNTAVIRQHDVQIMSAGTGIRHSEVNHHKDRPVRFLQIWVFPKEKNITPRYEQKNFQPEDRINQLRWVVSPDHPEAVWINQDAFFSMGNLKAGYETTYTLQRPGQGVYAFVIEGQATVAGQILNRRDGLGITAADQITIHADQDTELLLIEVPMGLH